MSNKIEFNYKLTMDLAAHIDGIADDMRSEVNKLKNIMESIGVCWSGEAAQKYLQYLQDINTDIIGGATELDNTSRRIREMAKTIVTAEEEVKKVISQNIIRNC